MRTVALPCMGYDAEEDTYYSVGLCYFVPSNIDSIARGHKNRRAVETVGGSVYVLDVKSLDELMEKVLTPIGKAL